MCSVLRLAVCTVSTSGLHRISAGHFTSAGCLMHVMVGVAHLNHAGGRPLVYSGLNIRLVQITICSPVAPEACSSSCVIAVPHHRHSAVIAGGGPLLQCHTIQDNSHSQPS